MKGLLIKDFFTLTKQMKVFLLFIAVMSFFPNSSMQYFAVIYSAMLPTTALAYDERSKWNSYAAMLPYSAKNMVLSKYVLSYILIFCAAVLSCLAQFLHDLISHEPFTPENFIPVLLIIFAALVFQAINMPFMFRLGVEKGRILLFILFGAISAAAVLLSDKLPQLLDKMDAPSGLILLDVALLAVIVNAVSIAASVHSYKKAEK